MSFNEVDNQQYVDSDRTENRPNKSCGAILFAERKRQNLSVEQISKEINLSATQIRALESDKYDILASASYIKGYIRLYINLLGLDVDEVLPYFKEPVQNQNTSLSNIGRGIHKTRRTSSSNILKFLLYLLLFAGLGAFIWFALFSFNWTFEEHLSIIPALQNEKLNERQSKNQSIDKLISESSVADSLIIGNEKEQLVMSFSDGSWVEVIDKYNQQIINKRYQLDEKLSVYAQPPLRIFIGNVEAVSMQYHEIDYDLEPHRQGVFAKFILK